MFSVPKTPLCDYAFVKRIQAKSYLLELSPKPSTEEAEEKGHRGVNGTDSMPICEIRSMLTGYHKPEKALN